MVLLGAGEAAVVAAQHAARHQGEVAAAVAGQVLVVVKLSANLVLLRLIVLRWNRRRLHERRWARQSRSNQFPQERLVPLGHCKGKIERTC